MSVLGVPALLRLPIILPPIQWIEENVDLTRDSTSVSDGLVVLDPYQRAPVEAQFIHGVSEVIVMAPPQTGKSICWRLPLLYKILFIDGPRWIIYESDEKAEDINAQQFDPLLRSIPALTERLNAAGRYSSVRRQYRFATGPVDFSGAGVEPTSKPERDGVADELDTWPLTNPQKRKTLASFRDRFATWWRSGEGCLVICSSPNGQDSAIGAEFERSSRGHWHLRCLGCGDISMASHHIGNLQWASTEDGQVIANSIRLICPACKREHVEAEATAMNGRGEYIHALPFSSRRGFHWGALASPRTKSWEWIASAQMDAGAMAPIDTLQNFSKTVLGMPYRPKTIRRDQVEALRSHIGDLPDPQKIAGIFLAADTQDSGWYWIVRAIDVDRNTYQLGHGMAPTKDALLAVWNAKYMGLQPIIGMIDEGGHRGPDVWDIAKNNAGLYAWKGSTRTQKWAWQKATTGRQYRLTANPYYYQSELLYYCYSQDRREGNYFYLPANIDEEYMTQICSVQPDRKVRNGHHYENWRPVEGSDDHYFDCEKIWRCCLAFAEDELKKQHWYIAPPWLFSGTKMRRKSTVNMEG